MFFKTLALLSIVMFVVAMITYLERRILAVVQLRKGPDVVGWHGLLQPIADCFKLLNKQILWPKTVYKKLFVLAPFISIFFLLSIFCYLPIFGKEALIKNEYSLFIILVLSILSAFGECLAGLVINSPYQRLGAFRVIIQVVSYELCIGLCFLNIGIIVGGYNFEQVFNYHWLIVYVPHVLLFYIMAALAQANRTPFDTLEAEQELIAGYHTEYSSILFCTFYISEYTNILLISLMIVLLFLGGGNFLDNDILWFICLFIKTFFVVCGILFIRAVLPRYRFYNILGLFWLIAIPLLILSAIFFMLIL